MRAAGVPGRPFGAAFVLGFALSGFFDGILLHQILQWHHLLSLVDDEALRGFRVQVMADGLFHALMYVVALVGLSMLWRARRDLAVVGARTLLAGVLIGFGVWNIADVGLFHWGLGIHRTRLDVPNPLVWDIGWLAVFGLAPAAAGLAAGWPGSPGGRGSRSAAAVLLLTLALAGAWNLRPPPVGSDILVLFRPGADPVAAVAAVDAAIVDLRPEHALAVLRLRDGASAWRLYRYGAVVVQGTGPSGCLNWTRPARGSPGD
ncbi:MAG: DUF2243 domain-containing protein [Brevundimonas sp.]